MSFNEICIYQVKPKKTEEFDTKENYGTAQKNLYESY